MTNGIFQYSTTPANNVLANTGVNWDEGMSPGAVNNSARQVLTDIRNQHNDLMWFQYGSGDSPVNLPVYVSGTQFKIAGVNVTAKWEVSRRVKAVGSGTGTIYGTITVSAFSTDTTVTVAWDSGSLSNETLTIYLSQIPITGVPVSGPIAFPPTQISSSNANTLDDYEEGTWTPADGSGASLTFTTPLGNYVKIGRVVHIWGTMVYPATANGSAAAISGLPFTALNSGPSISIGTVIFGGGGGTPGSHANYYCSISKNTATISLFYGGGSTVTNAELTGGNPFFYICYQAAT